MVAKLLLPTASTALCLHSYITITMIYLQTANQLHAIHPHIGSETKFTKCLIHTFGLLCCFVVTLIRSAILHLCSFFRRFIQSCAIESARFRLCCCSMMPRLCY